MLIFNFCVLATFISIQISNISDEFAYFYRIIVICGGSLLIVGVSLFAIVYHAILNKLESEKRMKFVTERLRVVLENNSVKTTQEHLALIFDRYIKQVPDTDK